jgi:hypothetical protein
LPELDDTHTIQRLQRRIAELEAGDEIAKRDIYAVLNEQQQQELESELAALQALKKQSRARTDEEKKAFGWKTIREVRIEVLKRALAQAGTSELDAWKKKQHDSEVRGARIYLDAFFEARKAGKTSHTAHTWANNALTRAGLSRMDGRVVGDKNARDKAVRELEEKILRRARSEMTAEELEQLELLEEHLKAIASRRKGRKDQTD